jgi:hypothetical protein
VTTPEIGDTTVQSTEAMEVVADVASLLSPAEVNMGRAETIARLAMLRVRMVVSPVPEGARPILVDMVYRAYTNPQGAVYETAGPFSRSFREAGVYLKPNERADLEALAASAAGHGAAAFTIRPGAPGWCPR